MDTPSEMEKTIDETNQPKSEELSIEVTQSEREETLSEKEIKDKLKELGDYDPTLELSDFKMPGIDLLKDYEDSDIKIDKEELESNKENPCGTKICQR